jgi:hypothetical protein
MAGMGNLKVAAAAPAAVAAMNLRRVILRDIAFPPSALIGAFMIGMALPAIL